MKLWPAAEKLTDENFDSYLELLRGRWDEVPLGMERVSTKSLQSMGDSNLLRLWDSARDFSTTPDGFLARGWYHVLYTPILKDKKVLDVGSGPGIDAITFAERGAQVTCLDIVETNLQIIRRISELKKVHNIDFAYFEKEASLDSLESDFDFVWCQGSLICAPMSVIRQEAQDLVKHLKPHGRWVELAYPKARWIREGSLRFDKWGSKTDGGAPWMEWYDLTKLLEVLAPSKFKPILNIEFHNSDFNWFDLLRE